MKPLMIALMSTGIAAAMLDATPARASDWSSAVDVCQGSLPSFEGALRKRPLGIANEGMSSSFVSCSIRARQGLVGDVISVSILLTNRGASTSNFSCTLIEGVAMPFPNNPPIYQPKSISIAAGDYGVLEWTQDEDNGGERYLIPNLSCSLPVGAEINVVQVVTP